MATESGRIKELVQERYGERAKRVIAIGSPAEPPPALRDVEPLDASAGQSGADCCAPADCCATADAEYAMRLYAEGQLAGLPAGSVAASAGCGNPTALAGLRPGERVLDLGSGGGIDCFLAARQVGESGRVTGLDMTPAMLELARKNLAALGLTNVEFAQGEMEAMPLPSDAYDAIISNCVVCLSPDKDAVFRESFRVLAPGGRIHLSDVLALTPEGPAVSGEADWVACTAGAEHRDAYLGRLSAAGFVDIEIEGEAHETLGGNDEPGSNTASFRVTARKPQ